ncbi:MAG: ferredoxin [Thermoproteota archaeon]|jgi:uncharacterized 2Fe-2S/4Fe-4S cluster protein (DUF4445 family)|uniref:DUF4445 domain-containing protein n=1 Tax=Candidatus Methanodesulfokora washburnensis TaxID=2478471 RepID=A0A429GGG3_9CREN|nr:ASKHA domain-containing protein [Candidatus Methanodesulfokores washburnensis]RSN72845.1 DUF4445 domain-containing protein [Candidatus Methanodesulfokores washburnensis]RZN63739.1 MAG: DUF4445 domain-containing protein [Candidatus Methanodesulfokores washburnensis]TDA40872.1 MAG: ferredoxin [Candidatus Korarchaeota archaeon]
MFERRDHEDDAMVIFQPHGRRGSFKKGTSILDAAKELGVDISSVCGGRGLCGKCKVKIVKGSDYLSPADPSELKFLTKEEIEAGYRLACCAKIFAPCEVLVLVPERSRVGKQRLQTEGFEVPVMRFNPAVRKYFIEMSPPTLENATFDDEMVIKALAQHYNLLDVDFHYEVLRFLPKVLRDSNWKITVTVWKNTIIDVEPGDTTNRCFGFACDIGSTKLAGFLMDLNTGKVLSVAARMNPQISYGEDILTRLTYVLLNGWKGLEDLQKAVVNGINEMIEECCEKAGVKPEEIYETVFVGNTAMMMYFLKIWPEFVAKSPFQPPRMGGVNLPAREAGIKCHPRANLYFLDTIGGWVGADNVANMIVTKLFDSEKLGMCIDVGTNTEIGIGCKATGVWYSSCASGPAFEGMMIKYGMRAADGAIEKIAIDPETLEPSYRVIGDTKPVGICGSGIVDIMAELFKSGIIDWSGRFNKELAERTRRIRLGPDGWEYVIAWKEETASGEHDIVFTQKDVREIQKAKAAIHAVASILCKLHNVTEKDINVLYVVGAFGNYIDPESARTIGMYPEVPIDRIKFVGNSAGTGARMALISVDEREYITKAIKEGRIRHFEIAAYPKFNDEYVSSMYLPHKDLKRFPETIELIIRLGTHPEIKRALELKA